MMDTTDHANDIAIIGMAGRFPQANDVNAFWRNLCEGVESIARFSDHELAQAGVDPALLRDPRYVRAGTILERLEYFDAAFFGIHPRQAELTDPQQRLFIECAWEALEHAGYAPGTSHSSVGVYAGASISSYLLFNLLPRFGLAADLANLHMLIGNDKDYLATQVSYQLNLKGPSIGVQTACSTSLVAVHLACQGLLTYECDLALAGGVTVRVPQPAGYLYAEGGIVAPDGHCRAFDAQAQGTVFGSGVGIVVLKRLANALADRDTIYAVVKGSAINNDGALKVGFTAPSVAGQRAVIAEALSVAGVDPGTITYIEAHGTGTALGDPIEIDALTQVFRTKTDARGFCAIGSLKTNVGHLEAAAGVASLIKAALALKHQLIPPSLHFEQPNPHIDFASSPFYLNATLSEWRRDQALRRAGVSSFGIGGTNAHVVLEEAPPLSPVEVGTTRPLYLLGLSAKQDLALQQLAGRYERYFAASPAPLADVAYTAHVGRAHFEHRLAVVADSAAQMQASLAAFAAGQAPAAVQHNHIQGDVQPKIVFLFTGQGSQYIGMGRQLYETEPAFRTILDRCDALLRPVLQQPLLSVLYPASGALSPLDTTAYAQPALFALEYALAHMWRSWGVVPALVLGHSLGEYVAACIAGVFSLEDGLRLVAERGRLMQALPQLGEMAAVAMDELQVRALIAAYADMSIAAVNGPEEVVISGEQRSMRAVVGLLAAAGVRVRRLAVSHAFHSPLMEPILDSFEQTAAEVTFAAPQIGLISSVTGQLAQAQDVAQAGYWRRHARAATRFADSMRALEAQGCTIFIEIGPQPTLLAMGQHCLAAGVGAWLPSLRKGRDDWRQMLESLGALYIRGVPIDWDGYEQGQRRCRVPLPTYPFQGKRYWVDPAKPRSQQLASAEPMARQGSAVHPLLGRRLRVRRRQPDLPRHEQLDDWFYQVAWLPKARAQPQLGTEQPARRGRWLIFADRGGVGQTVARLLDERGEPSTLVVPGSTFGVVAPEVWAIDPAQPADFRQLIREVRGADRLPCCGIIHLWSLDIDSPVQGSVAPLPGDQRLGSGSALHLVQALAGEMAALPRIWLVTRGAQAVESAPTAITQAPLWGLGRVIALEHPEAWGGLIDIDPDAPGDEAMLLMNEILASDGEDQLAFRGGQRYVARLVHSGGQATPVQLQPDATYVITGGLGGLGLALARWMVERGARHLALLGRQGAVGDAGATVYELEQAGARVAVIAVDVAQADHLATVFAEIQQSLPPLRGIIHAAGILDDGVLEQQDWARFAQVSAPKVAGAWNIHLQSLGIQLDFFVLFSSAVALLGSPAQGNYAAANAFLDSLAHYRRAQGLPALSINWGPWSGVGMWANARGRTREPLYTTATISPQQGVEALARALQLADAQVAVLPIARGQWRQIHPAISRSTLLADLLADRAGISRVARPSGGLELTLERLNAAVPAERQQLIETYLLKQAVGVLGLDETEVSPHQSLAALGFDSLMAIMLKNGVGASLGVTIPLATLLQDPSIAQIAQIVCEQLSTADSALASSAIETPEVAHSGLLDRANAAQLATTLDQLSDEQVTALLGKLLVEDERGA